MDLALSATEYLHFEFCTHGETRSAVVWCAIMYTPPARCFWESRRHYVGSGARVQRGQWRPHSDDFEATSAFWTVARRRIVRSANTRLLDGVLGSFTPSPIRLVPVVARPQQECKGCWVARWLVNSPLGGTVDIQPPADPKTQSQPTSRFLRTGHGTRPHSSVG
jgi:hypothetical protein